MTVQKAVLYRADGTVENLADGDWDSSSGWNQVRKLLGCPWLEQQLVKFSGAWIKFLFDEEGKLKEVNRVNLKATCLWHDAHGISREKFLNSAVLVGDVVVLTYSRKPRG